MRDKMFYRYCRKALSATILFVAAACTSSPPPSKTTLATSEDIWRLSGTKDALVDLHQMLSIACQAKLEKPDDFLTLPAGQAICVRSRLVEAFNAAEGAAPCSQGGDLKRFVSCILEGQFIGSVIKNSGSSPLPVNVQWGNHDERGEQASKLISDKVRASCSTPSKSAMNECIEISMFRYFEVSPETISFCPSKQQRDICIYWASFARSIRLKLDQV